MSLPLPEGLTRRLRATRQWVAIALPPEEALVDVRLVARDGELDVSGNCTVAALKPLTLRLELNGQTRAALSAGGARLHLDRRLSRVIGVLGPGARHDWEVAGSPLELFEVQSATHYCASWLRRLWDTFLYERAARRAPAHPQIMTPADVSQLLTFHLHPRPVYLAGVNDGRHSNLLSDGPVGPPPCGRFTLALRNTSVSVETIKSDRRLVLSDLLASVCAAAYKLGAHHKNAGIDSAGLPFGLLESELFQLPVPEIALRVREAAVLDHRTVGSHTLFVGAFRSERTGGCAPATISPWWRSTRPQPAEPVPEAPRQRHRVGGRFRATTPGCLAERCCDTR